jgi:cytochrome c peroxidase
MFNIGLDEVYADNGLFNITKLPGDKGAFKVPTLQNIAVTAPYMHDGRFATLGEVIDHYSHNIKNNPALDGQFRNFDGTPKKLNISPVEKKMLIAFLNTLKNDDFLTHVMYSDPFKK